MAETKMNVTLIGHTQLTNGFAQKAFSDDFVSDTATDGQAVALSAIRTCYSPGKPSEIVAKEGAKYFGAQATDGKEGTEADRLFRMIIASKHTSTLEGISFNFAIEGVSRALLAQLTRHRVGFSFSVQSQRYVKFGSGDRSGGFDYVVPDSILNSKKQSGDLIGYGTDSKGNYGRIHNNPKYVFESAMERIQEIYDELRDFGIPAEDCRAVLPNAAATNLVMTANLRALLDFYAKRQPGKGAQGEIAQLAEALKSAVMEVEPWTKTFFEGA